MFAVQIGASAYLLVLLSPVHNLVRIAFQAQAGTLSNVHQAEHFAIDLPNQGVLVEGEFFTHAGSCAANFLDAIEVHCEQIGRTKLVAWANFEPCISIFSSSWLAQ